MRVLGAILLLSMLAGCERADDVESTGNGNAIPLSERMATMPDPDFARATEPREFRFPRDHGPHPEFATEWWYFTGNLVAESGRRFGYQLTLFRVGLQAGPPANDSAWRTKQIYMGHIAISDIDSGVHISDERFSRAAVGLAGAQSDPLHLWLGSWSVVGQPQQSFPLRLRADTDTFALDLDIARGKRPLVLQGEQGLSRKGAAPGNASYYYSLTRLPTRGNVRIGDQSYRITGDSWFDREWSSSALAADQAGWDWFAIQLENGSDLMYYRMRGTDGKAQAFSQGMLLDRDGTPHRLAADDVTLTPLRTWASADGTRYPVEWQMTIPRHDIRLVVEAAFDKQEMHHTVRYWEGAVDVTGTHVGRGYLELSGYADRTVRSVTDQAAQSAEIQ